MTIRSSESFSYAGIKCSDYGIVNVNINSGMLEEPFAAPRTLQEVSIGGRGKPYFQGIAKDPLKFQVSFAFEQTWNTRQIREIARWLTEQDYYKELIFSSDPERVFYALAVDEPTLVHNALSQGYVNLTFRCDSPYSYSPVYSSPWYEWQDTRLDHRISDFSAGTKPGLAEDASGQLVLDSKVPRWSDYSGAAWPDIT
ncbi:distal tail protein Dit [Paenibacillus apiarius]|uniref:Phage tail family protein n=1 Tax=Paenibacillus apiarius TaxID=46240 RepID=A0ABT4DPB3_9BACL|nr:distal tail protein Dit [Paenibacillus apiarius]MCY9517221.1 phage tail family protein [Paenibacillus apiarius]MCY9519184.1 phage tail family protein [Paenibacillus apiarius]MCY9551033.1 phage tail family protein [Paenibacillus apiarius]MCY9560020.1 phage tail family protein [Paenibacillus apiarius]MCY9683337.1 phage tail family protein [Paenibacillus apiarius]